MKIKKILLWILFIIVAILTCFLILGALVSLEKGFRSADIFGYAIIVLLMFVLLKLWKTLHKDKKETIKETFRVKPRREEVSKNAQQAKPYNEANFQTEKISTVSSEKHKYLNCIVSGTNYKEKEIKSLIKSLEDADEFQKTEEWSYSAKKADAELIGDRAWKYEPLDIKAKLEPDPDNPYDSNAIKVLAENADGDYIFIGYIPKKENRQLLDVIENIDWISIEIKGGKYKDLDEDDDGSPIWKQGSAKYNFEISIRYKAK